MRIMKLMKTTVTKSSWLDTFPVHSFATGHTKEYQLMYWNTQAHTCNDTVAYKILAKYSREFSWKFHVENYVNVIWCSFTGRTAWFTPELILPLLLSMIPFAAFIAVIVWLVYRHRKYGRYRLLPSTVLQRPSSQMSEPSLVGVYVMWCQFSMLKFPQRNFSLEFPEILSQNHICHHWLGVSGISKITYCGVLINMAYFISHVKEYSSMRLFILDFPGIIIQWYPIMFLNGIVMSATNLPGA